MWLDFVRALEKSPRVAPHALPQRNSLVAQTVAFLRAQIDSGEWSEWLPNERLLSQHLQVSRNTLRAALVQLKSEEVIRPVHGAGNLILGKSRRGVPPLPSRDVALLTPEPVERLLPIQSLWIDEMRALLTERGIRLHVFHGHQYFTVHGASSTRPTFANSWNDLWILPSRLPPAIGETTCRGIRQPSCSAIS